MMMTHETLSLWNSSQSRNSRNQILPSVEKVSLVYHENDTYSNFTNVTTDHQVSEEYY